MPRRVHFHNKDLQMGIRKEGSTVELCEEEEKMIQES
jgi:hypothetical protein